MGVEICSRNEYPATERNFLFKLSIDSDTNHLGTPSYFRKLTCIHSDKTLKLICHSENLTFPCLLPGAFQHLRRARGAPEALNSLCPPRRHWAEGVGAPFSLV